MKSKIDTVEYVCDGCHKSKVVREADGQPVGIHGTASKRHEHGSTETVEFYACSTRCIGKAVQNAIEAHKEEATDPAQTAEDLAEERATLAQARGIPDEDEDDEERTYPEDVDDDSGDEEDDDETAPALAR